MKKISALGSLLGQSWLLLQQFRPNHSGFVSYDAVTQQISIIVWSGTDGGGWQETQLMKEKRDKIDRKERVQMLLF